MNDSSSSGEGETPCCAVGATPAGGVNTATSAILNRFQQHPQQKNDVGPSASALSAINPSYTEQPSPLKARKLSTNSSSKNKNNRSRHSKGNPYEKFRPHVFRNDLEVDLAKEDRLIFQNEFNNAKNYNFGKRQLSQQEKESKQKFHQVFNHNGFGSEHIVLLPVKGDTSQLCRYLIEDLIRCGSNSDPFLIAVRMGKNVGGTTTFDKVFDVQKNRPEGLGGVTHPGVTRWKQSS